jgi:hypothetical protein
MPSGAVGPSPAPGARSAGLLPAALFSPYPLYCSRRCQNLM